MRTSQKIFTLLRIQFESANQKEYNFGRYQSYTRRNLRKPRSSGDENGFRINRQRLVICLDRTGAATEQKYNIRPNATNTISQWTDQNLEQERESSAKRWNKWVSHFWFGLMKLKGLFLPWFQPLKKKVSK